MVYREEKRYRLSLKGKQERRAFPVTSSCIHIHRIKV
jgi:hypothetical protein